MWQLAVMGAMSAYSAYSGAKATNQASAQAEAEAQRRYALQSSIAKNQMEEQQSIAMEKMTDISREFLKAKSQATAVQAETMVGGNTAQRISASTRSKASEAKSRVATEANTNIINIANDMLAKKIDTEAIVAQARIKRKNVGIDTIVGGVSGALQGYAMNSSLQGLSSSSNTLTPVQQNFLTATNGMSADRVASIGASWTQSGVFK